MIGPKYDEFGGQINFEENRKYFVFIDMFKHNLVAGENIIKRSSADIMFYGNRQTSFYDLYKRLMAAKSGETKWTPDLYQGRCQLPRNFMIPKGKVDGMLYQFYFVISEFQPAKIPFNDEFNPAYECGVGSGARFYEDRALLFPIDRHIDAKHFYVPNMHFTDVEIHFNPDESEGRYY